MNTRNKGLLFVFLTAAISGFSIWINKFGASGINPFVFTSLKNTIVAGIFVLLLFSIRKMNIVKKLKKGQVMKLTAIGVIGGSTPFLLFFYGLKLTSALNASFIHKTMFIYVGIFSFVFLKERLSRKQIFSIALLFAGLYIYSKVDIFSFAISDLFILVATLMWSIEIILSKHMLKDLPSSIVAWSRMFFGSIFLISFLVMTNQFGEIFLLTSQQWTWILITSALLFGYVFTFYKGLKQLKAVEAAAVLIFGVVITSSLSFLDTGAIQLAALAGIFLISSSLVLLSALQSKSEYSNRSSYVLGGDSFKY